MSEIATRSEPDLVLFEILRERGRQWVRAKHKNGTKTGWHLVGQWTLELREEILAELNRLLTPAI